MIKIKYLLLSLLSMLFCLFTFVSVPINKVSADTADSEIYGTYTFNDSTCDEYYGSSINAIDRVVSADVSCSPSVSYEFTVNDDYVHFYFLSYGISGSSYEVYDNCYYRVGSDLYDKIPTNVNITFEMLGSSSGEAKFLFHPTFVNYGNGYFISRLSLFPHKTYKVTFSTYGSLGYCYLFNNSYTSESNSLVDMNSETSLQFFNKSVVRAVNTNKYYDFFGNINSSGNNIYSGHSSFLSGMFSKSYSGEAYSVPNGVFFTGCGGDSEYALRTCSYNFSSNIFKEFYDRNVSNGEYWLCNISNDITFTTAGITDYVGQVGNYLCNDVVAKTSSIKRTFSLNIINFEVLIDMPTYRSQNSLLIYNYDYNSMLSNCSGVSYRLLRDSYYYDIVYNGTIPNKQVLVINNPNINNLTFSNYIYVKFNFDSPVPIRNDGTVLTCFDFNFGNYVEPFPQVTVNSSEATFDRPDLPTDLTPRLNFEKTDTIPWFKISLYFPVVKYIEYAFIWLLFYCPVIGDCTAFLYTFFNKFLDIFNIVIELPLGTFIVSFICFILCFKLFSYFVPFLSNKTSVTVKNISNKASNSIKSNKEFIKEQNKEKEKERRLHKQTKKIMNKSIKKYNKQINKKK